MTINNILYVTTRKEWRCWLHDNFDKATEVWLVYPKKETGEIRILYNDAVGEALCFGGIEKYYWNTTPADPDISEKLHKPKALAASGRSEIQ